MSAKLFLKRTSNRFVAAISVFNRMWCVYFPSLENMVPQRGGVKNHNGCSKIIMVDVRTQQHFVLATQI